jgi:hypothetical protein
VREHGRIIEGSDWLLERYASAELELE